MKKLAISLTFLFLSHGLALAQEVVVYYPPMLIHKQKIGLWLAEKEPSTATVTLPSGKIEMSGFIPPTYVRGVVNRSVDPCVMWVHSDKMDQLWLNLPEEKIVLRGLTPVAVAITATGTLTMHDGGEYAVVVEIPECRTRTINLRTREAEAVIAVGFVTIP